MLDIKILRTEPEKIIEALKKRNNPLDITPAIELDKKRRELLTVVEQKKASQNEITKKVNNEITTKGRRKRIQTRSILCTK